MHISLERLDQSDVLALIDALDAYQKPLYPAVSHHGLESAAFAQPHVLFAVARNGDHRGGGNPLRLRQCSNQLSTASNPHTLMA